MGSRDAALQRWWLVASIALLVVVGATIVAQAWYGDWPDRPSQDGGVEIGSTGDGLWACATDDEIVGPDGLAREVDEPLHIEAVEVDGLPYLLCTYGRAFGRLFVRVKGEDRSVVDDPYVLGALGAVPYAGGRSRAGITMWGLVVPLVMCIGALVYQRFFRHAALLRVVTLMLTVLVALHYLQMFGGSVRTGDEPGLLSLVVATIVVLGMFAYTRVDLGRVLRQVAPVPTRTGTVTPTPPASEHAGNRQGSRRSRRGRGRRRNRRGRTPASPAMPAGHADVVADSDGGRDDAGAASPGDVAAPGRPAAPAATEPVDVNDADATTLATLPGVNMVAAQRIVDSRLERGRIDDFDELCEIVQPTRRVRDQLRDRVTFGAGGVALDEAPSPDHADRKDPYGGRKVDL